MEGADNANQLMISEAIAAFRPIGDTFRSRVNNSAVLKFQEQRLQEDHAKCREQQRAACGEANAAEATRMNTPIENIPMNVTVFNQQFIEDLLATDTSDVLAYDASAMKRTENDGFMARGSASVGTNFLDGFAQTGGFGSQPLANIERVEVLRGPAAILYGSGGYGATFNRITKQPRPAATTALISSSVMKAPCMRIGRPAPIGRNSPSP